MKKTNLALLVVLSAFSASSQTMENKDADTVPFKSLDSVYITTELKSGLLRSLPDVRGTYIYGGKKNEIIQLTQADADLTNKIGRQVFVKIPGAFVYDMDGSGNQINVSTRGLDPHRGWEFNNRKDGIITNSDMYGYPASHYSMPLESIERIELVRGTGSLQYGAQFGGMLNYVTKTGDTSRNFSFETINSFGSYRQLSTYNAIGGKIKKLQYYAYFSRKSREGYRENEHTDSEAEGAIITFTPNDRFSIRVEYARSMYLYRIPGPLTDSMFYANPKGATRSRNYFNPDIHIPSVTMMWQVSPLTRLQLTTSAVLGNRNSVLYDKPANVPDTINPATLQYNNRQVDIDRFHSYTSELRLLQQYRMGKRTHNLVAGIQYMNNDLHRTQLGKGTTGSDFDLTLVDPNWGRDLHFKTHNIALFAENNFRITNRFSANVGARVEIGESNMSGSIVYYPENQIPVTIEHHFPLIGLNLSYKMNGNAELYAGWSQAYRPVLFKDIIPSSTFEKVDPNIKDAYGYNLEAGFRGNWKFLRWDVSGYLLQYTNRFGTLAETDAAGNFYTYRTNIGNSLTKGLEAYLQADWLVNSKLAISAFTSTALVDARYRTGIVKSGNNNVDIKGNKVESAPDIISRNGLIFRYWKFNISSIYSYTAKSYADALNTIKPPPTGAVGLVPAYGILDLNLSFGFSRMLEVKMNLNNLTNKQYFTKRPMFYPGPGVWSSEGRSVNCSISLKI